MPKVPEYTQRQVQPGALPATRLQVNAGAAFAAAERLGETGQAVGTEIFVEEQRKADEIAVMSATRKLKQGANDLLYNPKSGAMTKKGQDSFGLPDEVIPAYDKMAGDIEMTLGSDRQKAVYRRQAEAMRAETDLTVQRHVYQERTRYDTEETSAAVKTAIDSAGLRYNDPRWVATQVSDLQSTLTGFAQRTGKGPEWTKEQVEGQSSKLHLNVIQAALSQQDDKYAAAYYKEVKPFLRGDDAEKAAKAVEDGSIRGESQRIVDEMFKGGLLKSSLQAELEKISDPKLRDAVQQRAEVRFNQNEQVQHEQHDFATKYAIQHVEKGGTVDNMPQAVLDQLTVSDRSALRHYKMTLSRGESVETDWQSYYDLVNKATTDPAAFAKVNLMSYRNKLGDTEFKQIIGLQAAYNKKDDKFDDTVSGYRTTGQIVNDSLSAAGVDTTPNNKAEAQKVAKFRRMVDEQVMLFEQNNRKKPNTTETQSIVDNLLVQGVLKGGGWFGLDTKKRVYELEPGQTLAFKIDDIPFQERLKITNALKRANKEVTTDEIIRQYNLKINVITNR